MNAEEIRDLSAIISFLFILLSVGGFVLYAVKFYGILKKYKEGQYSMLANIIIFIFALLIVCSLLFYSITPASTFSPNAYRNCCNSNLKQIGLALRMYAQDNNGFYPPYDNAKGLEMLRSGSYLENTKMYYCPSNISIADNILDRSEITEDSCSYAYRGGMKEDSPKNVTLAWDKRNNHKKFGNILYADGHVSGYAGTDWRKEITPAPIPEPPIKGKQKKY